ncbi:MAG: pseudouridine synthase [Candidatus Woesearchaeota archaeon]
MPKDNNYDNENNDKLHRVQKLLSNYGYCSRRKAEELIIGGRVKVNGKTITIGDKAAENDRISVDGKFVKAEKKVYIMFHKPTKCVTAMTDPMFDTVMDYIDKNGKMSSGISERIFPIGRLDYNTSGMLLLTNDGDFANNVMHPRYEIKKTYFVLLDKNLEIKDKRAIEKGIELEDGLTSPAKVKILDSAHLKNKNYKGLENNNSVEITIHEGRNRIVRRIFEELGYNTMFLKRIKIGRLSLGDLKEGKYRHLTGKDLDMIFT